MKKQLIRLTTMLAFAAITITGCKKDDDNVKNPTPPNEEELITTLKVILVDSANTADVRTFVYSDIDGDGGNPATADDILLSPGKTYYATLLLLNEAVNPVDTISKEIEEEAVDHLFIFEPHDANLSVVITDRDVNGLPLGLSSTWKTGAVGNTHIHITLKHQPGVKNGSAAPGEVDIEAQFEVKIQ